MLKTLQNRTDNCPALREPHHQALEQPGEETEQPRRGSGERGDVRPRGQEDPRKSRPQSKGRRQNSEAGEAAWEGMAAGYEK